MTDEDKEIEMERTIFHLEQKIKFNESIRCHRVAARYRRELERLGQLEERRKKGL